MTENDYTYRVIRRAIDILDAAPAPMDLTSLADKMGMSASHFQRQFSAWVGVSPKAYQQYLMLDHSKNMLKQNFTTLDTALNVGMSGTSRLHDLFIKWEAMSPGQYANGGVGLTISYGVFDTAFGETLIMHSGRGICGLAFCDEMGIDAAMTDMFSRWPNATFTDTPSAELIQSAKAVFDQKGTAEIVLIGAPFQIKVWQALLEIPSGHVTTYSEIAHAIGTPKAVRAVGTAVGRNPISLLIPCHRALRKTGALGGYHWGLGVKRSILAFETARKDAADPL